MADSVELDVYVDGACRNNGQQNPQGGCGVYWGEYHPLNTSEYLVGDKQTNNRAELTAAIIALEQAKQIQINTLNISTDSKYVQEGITKWILSWKTNGWKTKQKTDVLNKDLWQTIDWLSNEVHVSWHWVEGHTDVAGNIIADELAKSGISSECCYWQTTPNYVEREVFIERRSVSETRRSDVLQAKESRKSDVMPAKDFNCGCCGKLVSDDGIQCGDCKIWFHYICSKLPSYQLYMYEVSHRKYTCEICSKTDIDFSIKFDKLMALSRADETRQEQKGRKDENTRPLKSFVEMGTQIMTENRDMAAQTDNKSGQSMSDKCIPLEQVDEAKTSRTTHEDKDTQTPESFTSINKCLTEFQDGTVQRLENSFVNAVDNFAKAHNNTTDLQNQIRKLTQERDTLKSQKQHVAAAPEMRKCNCQTLQSKVQDLEIEAGKLRQKCFDLNLNKEVELSKIQGSMAILNQKYESSNTQLGILQQDVETLEKRLKLKNDVVLELEENSKKHNSEMLKLQDEVLAWKLHASRKDDTLIQQSNNDSVIRLNHDKDNVQTSAKPKDDTEQDKSHVRVTTPKQNQNKAEEVIDVEKLPDKKKVVLIGTSNLKFINASMLSNHKVEVEKEIKYTLKEGQEYIDSIKPNEKKVDAIVLHLFENDITEQTPEHCSERLHKLCVDIQRKSKDAKVIVSMGLPRREEAINRKIIKLNVLLQDKLGDMRNVSLCDNGNLFYRGQEARGVLGQDGKHLSRLGTTKLGANLRSAIYEVLGESTGQLRNRPHGNYGNGNGGNRNGGNRSGGNRNGGQWGYRPMNGYWRGGYN